MNWLGWSDFWAMGGKGLYVWGSYGVTFLLLAIEVLRLRSRKRAALESVRRLRESGAAR